MQHLLQHNINLPGFRRVTGHGDQNSHLTELERPLIYHSGLCRNFLQISIRVCLLTKLFE